MTNHGFRGLIPITEMITSKEKTMKTLQKTLLALAAGSLMTVGAQAAVNYGNGMTAQPYIGAKVGQFDLDDAKDKAFSYGVYTGVKSNQGIGVEAEYLTTEKNDLIKTDTDRKEYKAENYGLYATYDHAFPNTELYAKGRVGVAKNKIKVEDKLVGGKTSSSDVGIGGGLGFGYNLAPNAAVELAYEWYPKVDKVAGLGDLRSEGVTLGANFKF